MNKNKQLNFNEYLKELPPSIIFSHLVKDGGPARKIISAGLIESIRKEFASKEFLESRFNAMSPEVKMVCAFLYLSGSGGMKAEEFKEFRESLLLSFLIYSASDTKECEYYFGFMDMELLFEETLSSFIYNIAKSKDKAKSTSLFNLCCCNDFAMVLILAHKGLLKKKKNGALSQASLQELKNLLHMTSKIGTLKGSSKDIEKRIQLLLSYGTENNFLTEQVDSYVTTIAQVKDYLSKPIEECYVEFVDFAIAFSGGWSMRIMQKILDMTGDNWLSTSAFPASCMVKINTILDILHYTGSIDVSSKGTDLLWKCASEPINYSLETEQKVVILADFSAILPQESSSEVLFDFSLCGSFSNLDRVYKGVINHETVNESLSRGVCGEDMISYLEKWDAPENVVETVREWIREFSRVYILDNDVVVTCDEKSTMQIDSFEQLKDVIEPLTAHKVFKIKKGREEEAKSKLVAMGFDPRMPVVTVPQEPSTQDILKADKVEELTLLCDFNAQVENKSRAVTSGKYSNELKELDQSEVIHVIDYALLMGHSLNIDYEGSEGIKGGLYTIKPKKITNEAESCIKGKDIASGKTKEFILKKIKRIGVKSG